MPAYHDHSLTQVPSFAATYLKPKRFPTRTTYHYYDNISAHIFPYHFCFLQMDKHPVICFPRSSTNARSSTAPSVLDLLHSRRTEPFEVMSNPSVRIAPIAGNQPLSRSYHTTAHNLPPTSALHSFQSLTTQTHENDRLLFSQNQYGLPSLPHVPHSVPRERKLPLQEPLGNLEASTQALDATQEAAAILVSAQFAGSDSDGTRPSSPEFAQPQCNTQEDGPIDQRDHSAGSACGNAPRVPQNDAAQPICSLRNSNTVGKAFSKSVTEAESGERSGNHRAPQRSIGQELDFRQHRATMHFEVSHSEDKHLRKRSRKKNQLASKSGMGKSIQARAASFDLRLGEKQLRSGKRVRSSKSNIPGVSRYWTASEHKLFLQGLIKYGSKNLRKISEYVKSRNMIQCRTHEQKCFMRLMRFARKVSLNRSLPLSASEGDDAVEAKLEKDVYYVPQSCGLFLLLVVSEELALAEEGDEDTRDAPQDSP